MRSINSHFSIIISVFILLFSFQFTIVVNKVVADYSQKIVNDYSIIVVSSSELKEESLKKEVSEVHSLAEISSKRILDRLKNDMSSKNLSLLQVALPKFYSLKLETMPDAKRIEAIKQKLLAQGSITRVETFAKTHEKIFKMFVLLQYMVYIFTGFIAFIAILLILKQVRIWTYVQSRRMAIKKSAMLYGMTLVDSLLSAFLVCGVFSIAPKLPIVQEFALELDIIIPEFNFIYEGSMISGSALLLVIISVTLASRKIGRV